MSERQEKSLNVGKDHVSYVRCEVLSQRLVYVGKKLRKSELSVNLHCAHICGEDLSMSFLELNPNQLVL